MEFASARRPCGQQARPAGRTDPYARFLDTAAHAWMPAPTDSAGKFRAAGPFPPAGDEIRPAVRSHPPTAMARRNERERKRVRLVNHGFATLRQYLPQGQARKKLSKMETLRSAIEYIKQLQFLLDPPTNPADLHSWTDGQLWEDAAAWPDEQSPDSSPHDSLSPDAGLIDFAFS